MKSYSVLLYHIVFSTKHRTPVITFDVLEKLRSLAKQKALELKSDIIILNGYRDHVHILCRIHKSVSVAEFVRHIKGFSSHEMELMTWQRGYSVFTVDRFSIDKVFEYIKKQEEHHKRRDEEEGSL